jgi:hypothetical protein
MKMTDTERCGAIRALPGVPSRRRVFLTLGGEIAVELPHQTSLLPERIFKDKENLGPTCTM